MEGEERIREATNKRRITAAGVQHPKMIYTPVLSVRLFSLARATRLGRGLLLHAIAKVNVLVAIKVKE